MEDTQQTAAPEAEAPTEGVAQGEAPAYPPVSVETMGQIIGSIRGLMGPQVGIGLILFPPPVEGEPDRPVWGCTVPVELARGVLEAVIGSMDAKMEAAAEPVPEAAEGEAPALLEDTAPAGNA
jgi:hypothetical protein